MMFERDRSTAALELVALMLVLANIVAWFEIVGRMMR
jgi:hypothetical protein